MPKTTSKPVERYISLIRPHDSKPFYYCRITHDKKTHAKSFDLNELPIARAWVRNKAHSIGKKIGGIIRPGFTKRSNTGVKGVSLGYKDKTVSLICSVKSKSGKPMRTSFSIKKYGYVNAMQKAKAWVKQNQSE